MDPVGDRAGRASELARLEPAMLGFWPSHAWALARTGRLADAEAALRPYEAVAAGKTNRQVAHDLYISIKTVEFHISQILTRLGI